MSVPNCCLIDARIPGLDLLLAELRQKRTEQSRVRIELAPQAPEKVEALAVDLNDMLGPERT